MWVRVAKQVENEIGSNNELGHSMREIPVNSGTRLLPLEWKISHGTTERLDFIPARAILAQGWEAQFLKFFWNPDWIHSFFPAIPIFHWNFRWPASVSSSLFFSFFKPHQVPLFYSALYVLLVRFPSYGFARWKARDSWISFIELEHMIQSSNASLPSNRSRDINSYSAITLTFSSFKHKTNQINVCNLESTAYKSNIHSQTVINSWQPIQFRNFVLFCNHKI